jgi:hypothetical protein
MIPSYMLSHIYVKGSLKNTEGGFEFTLKNTVDSGTIIGIGPLTVDDEGCSPASLSITTRQGQKRGDEISGRAPVYLPYGTEARITVTGKTLAPGEHCIVLAVLTSEAGRLQIEFKDAIS